MVSWEGLVSWNAQDTVSVPTVEEDPCQAECGQGLLAKGPVPLGRWSRGGVLGHGLGLGTPGLEKQAVEPPALQLGSGSGLALVLRSFPLGVA